MWQEPGCPPLTLWVTVLGEGLPRTLTAGDKPESGSEGSVCVNSGVSPSPSLILLKTA